MAKAHIPLSHSQARYTLVFEELFIIQLRLALLRAENNKHLSSIPLKIKKDGLVMKFINNLPFKLTGAQQRAVNEILNDLHMKCRIGDGFLIGDEYQWISAIKNSCKCDDEIASRIFQEFLYYVDQDKIFTNKTKHDNRAMKKCIFSLGNKGL